MLPVHPRAVGFHGRGRCRRGSVVRREHTPVPGDVQTSLRARAAAHMGHRGHGAGYRHAAMRMSWSTVAAFAGQVGRPFQCWPSRCPGRTGETAVDRRPCSSAPRLPSPSPSSPTTCCSQWRWMSFGARPSPRVLRARLGCAAVRDLLGRRQQVDAPAQSAWPRCRWFFVAANALVRVRVGSCRAARMRCTPVSDDARKTRAAPLRHGHATIAQPLVLTVRHAVLPACRFDTDCRTAAARAGAHPLTNGNRTRPTRAEGMPGAASGAGRAGEPTRALRHRWRRTPS